MNIEALTRLADKLQGHGPYADIGPVPSHKFDLGVWCGVRGAPNEEAEELHCYKLGSFDHGCSLADGEIYVPRNILDNDIATFIVENQCGAAACACGWAGVDPWFKARGYTTIRNGSVKNFKTGNCGISGAADFFEIPIEVSGWLFMPPSYPDQYDVPLPDDVAIRIRHVIADQVEVVLRDGGYDEEFEVVLKQPLPPQTPEPAEARKPSTGSFDDWFDNLATHVRNKAQGD